MNDLKSFASRCLNDRGLDEPARKRWARHGSTRWLWKRENVEALVPISMSQTAARLTVRRVSYHIRLNRTKCPRSCA